MSYSTASRVSSAALSELVPAGRLRGGINYGNVILAAKSVYAFYLIRKLKRAKLVNAPSTHAAFELFATGKLDALVGLRPRLVADSEMMPGSRVVDGRFMVVEQSIASPKGRDAGAGYIREFIEDVIASKFVARSLEQNGVRGVTVAPKPAVF